MAVFCSMRAKGGTKTRRSRRALKMPYQVAAEVRHVSARAAMSWVRLGQALNPSVRGGARRSRLVGRQLGRDRLLSVGRSWPFGRAALPWRLGSVTCGLPS